MIEKLRFNTSQPPLLVKVLYFRLSERVVYVVVQIYPWFNFYFLLFQNHYHTLPYPKTKENKI